LQFGLNLFNFIIWTQKFKWWLSWCFALIFLMLIYLNLLSFFFTYLIFFGRFLVNHFVRGKIYFWNILIVIVLFDFLNVFFIFEATWRFFFSFWILFIKLFEYLWRLTFMLWFICMLHFYISNIIFSRTFI